jgi:hypothetical protein
MTTPQICAECGEVITSLQDIEYVEFEGTYLVFHTPAAHREVGYRVPPRGHSRDGQPAR